MTVLTEIQALRVAADETLVLIIPDAGDEIDELARQLDQTHLRSRVLIIAGNDIRAALIKADATVSRPELSTGTVNVDHVYESGVTLQAGTRVKIDHTMSNGDGPTAYGVSWVDHEGIHVAALAANQVTLDE